MTFKLNQSANLTMIIILERVLKNLIIEKRYKMCPITTKMTLKFEIHSLTFQNKINH